MFFNLNYRIVLPMLVKVFYGCSLNTLNGDYWCCELIDDARNLLKSNIFLMSSNDSKYFTLTIRWRWAEMVFNLSCWTEWNSLLPLIAVKNLLKFEFIIVCYFNEVLLFSLWFFVISNFHRKFVDLSNLFIDSIKRNVEDYLCVFMSI